MKAWHVFAGDPLDGSLLIFAENRNVARVMGLTAGLWDFNSYADTRARRAPKWDAYADRERVILVNEELPAGSEPFYNDEEW